MTKYAIYYKDRKASAAFDSREAAVNDAVERGLILNEGDVLPYNYSIQPVEQTWAASGGSLPCKESRVFWMVYNPKRSVPVIQHKTLEAATAEARRIAKLEPESSVFVLRAVCVVQAELSIMSKDI